MTSVGINTSLKVWVEFACEYIWSWIFYFVFGNFFITDASSLMAIGILHFSLTLCFKFNNLFLSRKLSIFSRLSRLEHTVFHIILLLLFVFLWRSMLFFPHISDFIYLILSTFLFDTFDQKFINFIIIFKEPVTGFIYLFYCILVSITLVLLLFVSYPSFCWLWASFVVFFASSFRYKIKLFI